jgi:hypothetical protein
MGEGRRSSFWSSSGRQGWRVLGLVNVILKIAIISLAIIFRCRNRKKRTSAMVSSFPSMASLMRLIVFSRLLLLVLGLVMVVPKLLVREWPPRLLAPPLIPPSTGVPGPAEAVADEGGLLARDGVSGADVPTPERELLGEWPGEATGDP